MLYNFGFRVLLGRLCADKKDFYNLLEQIVTFLLLFAGWKKNESAQPVRLCDNEDCYNSLPQMVTFPISSLRENKIKLKK